MRCASTSLILALGSLCAGAQCVPFGAFSGSGTLPTGLTPAGTLSEVSGVVASRHHPDVLWLHDDSGNGAYLVAVKIDGTLVQQYSLAGVTNRDWEDIAIGPGPVPGRDYLYIAEIGNNSQTLTSFALIRLPEPEPPTTPGPVVALTQVDVFPFQYPGSPTPDAEALLIDPVDGAPYVVTKSFGLTAVVYAYPLPLSTSATKTLVNVASLSLFPALVTAGDVAPDGSTIYLRTYLGAFAYPRARGTAFASAFAAPPCTITTGLMGQAEALAVTPDGLGLVAISEGAGATIYQAQGSQTPAPPGWWCFGSGLPGVQGVPGLGLDGPPVLNGPPTNLGIFGGKPAAQAFVAASFVAHPDGQQPLAGGWLHTDLDVILPVVLDAAGVTTIPIGTLPDDPLLYGVEVYVQAAVLDPAAVQGVALSRGLTIRLGP